MAKPFLDPNEKETYEKVKLAFKDKYVLSLYF